MDEIPKERHDHGPLKFPEGFLWGSAASAHQVEGNNVYSDWWEWEQKNQPPHLRSGDACDQYNRYEPDFELAKNLCQNAQRVSIEWARVEPRPGEFDHHEIEHYQKVLKSLKDKGFVVMLTLWHFTLPKWVAEAGGWENDRTVSYFDRFVQRVVPEIRGLVDFWVTVNEPTIYVFMSYLSGDWPPQKKSRWAGLKASWNLVQAHKKAYRTLHRLDSKPVGMAQNIQSFTCHHQHSLPEHFMVILSDFLTNHLFYTLSRGTHDFLGINYYFHHRFQSGGRGLFPRNSQVTSDTIHDVSDLGWEVFPEGIFDALTDLGDGKLPIYITECGIASTNDDRRTRFLMHYLQEVYRAIQSGANVKGFFYWSLIDNFEWHRGFDPRFGLIEIDYHNQRRIVRPSAYVYSKIARENAISHHLLKFLGHRVDVEDVLKESELCPNCGK